MFMVSNSAKEDPIENYLRTVTNNKFVSSNNGEKPMEATTKSPGEKEHFLFEKLDDKKGPFELNGKYALYCLGNYVSSQNGDGPMTCDSSKVGENETFEVITNQYDRSVAFKGNNGKYVCHHNGEKPMTCTSTSIGDQERFYIT